ncbi:MAG: hypothetical protein C4534_07425 [Gaiellales bacterium]|nr:MAG: hypothetical protein C4534_07425 [Gaiellales bacterium]
MAAAAALGGCLPGDDNGGGEADVPVPMWQDLLTDITFADANTGIVSGWGGRLLRTVDGGATWVQTKTGTEADLNSVAFLDGSVAVAVGAGGKMLRTTDAGMTWKELESPTGETLNQVVRAGNSLAIAAGWNGTILTSADKGVTWDATTVDFPNNYISLDYSQGVGMLVSSGGYVYRTLDGAASWEAIPLPENTLPASVSLFGGSRALLVGQFGEMLVSNNSGADWYEGSSILTADLLCSSFVGSPDAALAGGWDGVMIRTADGGSTWSTVTAGTGRPIRAIEALDALTVFAVGDGDTIIVSRDGGNTWQEVKNKP